MSRAETVITGVLRADGTLELNEKPKLSPGPVTVVLRPAANPLPQPPGELFFHTMNQIWAAQQVRGHMPRKPSEIEAARRLLTRQVDEEVEKAVHQQEESGRQRTQTSGENPPQ